MVDGLSAPLVITTQKSFEELGYNPAQVTGFFSIESKLLSGNRN